MNLRNGIAMLGLLALLCVAPAAEAQVAHLEPYRGQTITEIRIAGK
jgi:hypothetical protein